MPHTVENVVVKGARIRLMRGGAGPALLFLHGAGGHTGWMPNRHIWLGHRRAPYWPAPGRERRCRARH